MKDNIFNTKEEAEEAILSFRDLINSKGWQLLQKVIDENIAFLEKELISGSEGETMDMVNRIRDQLKLNREMRGLPDNLIKGLSERKEIINNDPYSEY